jgi:hypothetical protein
MNQTTIRAAIAGILALVLPRQRLRGRHATAQPGKCYGGIARAARTIAAPPAAPAPVAARR